MLTLPRANTEIFVTRRELLLLHPASSRHRAAPTGLQTCTRHLHGEECDTLRHALPQQNIYVRLYFPRTSMAVVFPRTSMAVVGAFPSTKNTFQFSC